MLKEIQKAIDHEACEEEINKILDLNPKSLDDLKDHENAPFWAYWYSSCVIKAPWPKGEKTIASDPQYSYYYARYVIKGPWSKGRFRTLGGLARLSFRNE